MTRGRDIRAEAARVIAEVAGHGRSLDRVLSRALPGLKDPRDRAFVQATSYGVIRLFPRLEGILDQLTEKPLRSRELPLKCLLLSGLYQISSMKVPDHAAVSATVSASSAIGRPGARGLVNAVLRRYLREKDRVEAIADSSPEGRWAHPEWMIERLAEDWPDRWEAVLEANNRMPPMWLRVNRSRIEREAWLGSFAPEGARAGPVAPESVLLSSPCDVGALAGFSEGLVSVQDAAAQLAAHLVAAKPGDRILDACAAPGSKAAHVLELCPGADLDALDLNDARLDKVRSSCDRLGLRPRVIQGDAARPQDWWDKRSYDRVLVDAPCTASGVIRRHPDIKLLRRESDIAQMAGVQAGILDGIWSVLGPGGHLVYSTCSVFPEENQRQISAFLERTPDAMAMSINCEVGWGNVSGAGRQILPGDAGMDGFYYACLTKAP